MLIGLTGLYCSGKNHVAAILENRGIRVLDVDKLGHIAVENTKTAIFSRFGEDLQAPDGSVNRRLLGERVFGRKNVLTALESIVHPEVNRLTMEWIAAQNGTNGVINAAVLHKSAVFGQLKGIILVNAPWFVRLIRAKRRDKLPWTALLQRFFSQREFITQYLAGNADIYKVDNSGFGRVGKARLEGRIDAILLKLGWEKSGGF